MIHDDSGKYRDLLEQDVGVHVPKKIFVEVLAKSLFNYPN